MRAAAAAIALLAVIGLVAVAYVVVDPFSGESESDPTVSLGLTGTACQRLAGLADQLADQDPEPAAFLTALATTAPGSGPARAASRTFSRAATTGSADAAS